MCEHIWVEEVHDKESKYYSSGVYPQVNRRSISYKTVNQDMAQNKWRVQKRQGAFFRGRTCALHGQSPLLASPVPESHGSNLEVMLVKQKKFPA